MKRRICAAIALLAAVSVWPSGAGAQVPSAACTAYGTQVFTLPASIGAGVFAAGDVFVITFTLQAGQPAGVVRIILNGGAPQLVNLNPANPTETVTIPVTGGISLGLEIEPPALGVVATITCQAAATYPLSASAPQSATDALSPVSLPEIDRVSNLPRLAAVVAFALIVNGVAITAVRRRRRIPSLGEPSPS